MTSMATATQTKANPYRAAKVAELVSVLLTTAKPAVLLVALDPERADDAGATIWAGAAQKVTALRFARGDKRTCSVPSAETRADVVARIAALIPAGSEPCSSCNGRGLVRHSPDDVEVCDTCDETGLVIPETPIPETPVNPATGKAMLLTPPAGFCSTCDGVIDTPGCDPIYLCSCPMDAFQAQNAVRRLGLAVEGCNFCGSYFLAGQHTTCETRTRGEALYAEEMARAKQRRADLAAQRYQRDMDALEGRNRMAEAVGAATFTCGCCLTEKPASAVGMVCGNGGFLCASCNAGLD